MNIFIVSHQSGIAGSTYSVSYLARGLSERGHQVWVGCPEGSLLWNLLAATPVRCLAMNISGKTDRRSIRQIAQIVWQHRIDVVNAQSSRDRYVTILAKWWYKLPCRLVHTRRQLSRSIGTLGQSTFYERGTDKIVAVSEGVKASLVKIGISPAHIHVIHNGTPPDKYATVDHQRVANLRQQHQIAEDDIVIGSVARLKEQGQILQALHYISRPLKVIFVGIDCQPAYQKIMADYPVPHQVHFTGSVSNETALHYYPLFRMNILASTIEGLSQALLEAMAMGVPVIATDVGGNAELIRHGENGFLFENNDTAGLARCMRQLIDDPGLRDRLATAGQKTALEDFSIDNTVRRYESFFLDLIASAQ